MDDPENPQEAQINENVDPAFAKLPLEERRKLVSEWREELSQVEYDIEQILQQLAIKNRQADFLRRKLGFSTWTEIKEDIQKVVGFVTDNYVYKKTGDLLKNTSEAASTLYGSLSEKLSTVLRN